MKTILTYIIGLNLLCVFVNADPEVTKTAPKPIKIIICGEVNSPREISLPLKAVVADAMPFINDSVTEYGKASRVAIWREDKYYRLLKNIQKERIFTGDHLEVPMMYMNEEQSRPYGVLIELDQQSKFNETVLTKEIPELDGVWRMNWYGGLKGRELRSKHGAYKIFFTPLPKGFLATSKDTDSSIPLNKNKNYILLRFHSPNPDSDKNGEKLLKAINNKFDAKSHLLKEWRLKPIPVRKVQKMQNKMQQPKR